MSQREKETRRSKEQGEQGVQSQSADLVSEEESAKHSLNADSMPSMPKSRMGRSRSAVGRNDAGSRSGATPRFKGCDPPVTDESMRDRTPTPDFDSALIDGRVRYGVSQRASFDRHGFILLPRFLSRQGLASSCVANFCFRYKYN
jgi:hypothetical protein